MKKTVFSAFFKLIRNRWAFTDAPEAERDYADRLWAQVCDWKWDQMIAFKESVDALISDKFRGNSRPSVQCVVETATHLFPRRSGEQMAPYTEGKQPWLGNKPPLIDEIPDYEARERELENLQRGMAFWKPGSREWNACRDKLHEFELTPPDVGGVEVADMPKEDTGTLAGPVPAASATESVNVSDIAASRPRRVRFPKC